MSNYTKTTNFATKDSLPSGDPNKIVKGAEINTEFDNIATAVSTKANSASPTFTGTVTIPTADINGGAIDGTVIGGSTAASVTGTTLTANTSLNIAGDGATVTGIKDEDDMASDSATKLATQQSIKAYVDAQVTAQDLDVTTDSGTISIDLDSETLTVAGGTGLDSSATGNTVTLGIDSTVATLTGTQTLTNKTLTAPVISGNLTTDGTIDGRDVATDGAKLDGIEANADVTDTANVTAAGALMDSEVTNLAQVKAFDSADYATAAQGTTADNALPKSGGTLTGDINFGDSVKANFGAESDLEIYHDGSQSYIKDAGTGDLNILASDFKVKNAAGTENKIVATTDGGVNLYHNNQLRVQTATTGVYLAGTVTFDAASIGGDVDFDGGNLNFGDNDKAIFGAGNDLEIYHNGSASYIEEKGTGSLYIKGTQLRMQATDGTTYLEANDGGALTIKHDGSTKLATTSTGIDVTGDVSLGDNGKAKFGAGNDLQIYHSGSESRIDENGAGNLKINADNLEIYNSASSEAKAKFNTNGSVQLYYDNAEKLATTSTGIDVTGTVSADGLTVDGNAVVNNATNATLQLQATGGNAYQLRTDVNDVFIYNATGARSLAKFAYGGDISFYEDTGTTPKFFWDASAESLGIGTSSPTQKLDISGGHLRLDDAYRIRFGGGTAAIEGSGSSNILSLITNNTERLRIDSSGRVGIGTSSPSHAIDVSTSATTWAGAIKNTDATNGFGLFLQSAESASKAILGAYSGSSYKFYVRGDGNVGIGTNSPTGDGTALHIHGSSASTLHLTNSTTGSAISDGFDIVTDGLDALLRNRESGAIKFRIGSSEAMRIDSSGQVGIGTSSPSLQVRCCSRASAVSITH